MARMISTFNDEIKRAAELLRAGRLVAFPTETVYGLGANALDPKAVRRIYEAKGRPSSSPLIVHVTDVAMARTLARHWPPAAQKLAQAFWPGPLTIVVPKVAAIPDEVTGGLDTVGLRVPAHPVALALLKAAAIPIAAPSANRFTQLSPSRAEHVRQSLGDRVDLILDGGPTDVGIESTVISVVGDVPLLLRPGMVSRAQLEAVLGPINVAGIVDDGVAHPSPGMHHTHYAPRTTLRIGMPPNAECGYLWHTEQRAAKQQIHLPPEPAVYAAGLYNALHQLDELALPVIYVEPVPAGDDWDGIRDRLSRADARNP